MRYKSYIQNGLTLSGYIEAHEKVFFSDFRFFLIYMRLNCVWYTRTIIQLEIGGN